MPSWNQALSAQSRPEDRSSCRCFIQRARLSAILNALSIHHSSSAAGSNIWVHGRVLQSFRRVCAVEPRFSRRLYLSKAATQVLN
eukprot:3862406-Pleurochrysis_carterae.AAC.1